MHTFWFSGADGLRWWCGWALAAFGLSLVCYNRLVGSVAVYPLFALTTLFHPLLSFNTPAALAADGPWLALGMYYWAVSALLLWPLFIILRARRTHMIVRVLPALFIIIGWLVLVLLSVFFPLGLTT